MDRITPTSTRVFDMVFALILGIVSLPVVLVAGLAVILDSRGGMIYSQSRAGRGGHPFRIYKLRTMTVNCETTSGIRWSGPNDSRVTRVGWVLRRLHIDELPQIWNVLRGDMSLVGPRPERPEIISVLEEKLPGYRRRLAVRPGLTGLAQIQHPPDTDLDSAFQKLAFDLTYVGHQNFWLDVRILLGTALYLLGVSYESLGRMMRFPQPGVVVLSSRVTAATRTKADRSSSLPWVRSAMHDQVQKTGVSVS
jgi:lipopolysaccharide/colanic/teichoic acid biosynthesis glycosyltransferase